MSNDISRELEVPSQDWSRLVNEGLVYDQDSNVALDFNKLSKKFGKAYIIYLKSAYQAKDILTDEEFCKLNGDVPLGFLGKLK